MRKAPLQAMVVHGWTVFAQPLFLDQVEALTRQVEALRRKDPAGYRKKNAAKRLAAIAKLAFDAIPQDPARAEYRQANALGEAHKCERPPPCGRRRFSCCGCNARCAARRRRQPNRSMPRCSVLPASNQGKSAGGLFRSKVFAPPSDPSPRVSWTAVRAA